jgi:hypothetical protein
MYIEAKNPVKEKICLNPNSITRTNAVPFFAFALKVLAYTAYRESLSL